MDGVAEELQGFGKILLGGTELGEVEYSIRVLRAGLKGWQYPFARFKKRGYLELFDFLNKPIILILDDGRRWNCRLKSLDGTVVAEGDWPSEGPAGESRPQT